MDKGPIGVIEEEIPSSGDEDKGPTKSTKGKDPEGPVGSAGARLHRHHSPSRTVEQLITTLREAGLTPQGCHGLDPPPQPKPKVKIPPPVFKGLPGERPNVHVLAAIDWMEAL